MMKHLLTAIAAAVAMACSGPPVPTPDATATAVTEERDRLRASATAVALAPPTAVPPPAPAARCPDFDGLFPEWHDPEGAVLAHLNDHGRRVRTGPAPRREPGNPMSAGLEGQYWMYQFPADKTVAGWIMTTLYFNQEGESVGALRGRDTSLKAHVDLQFGWRFASIGNLRRGQIDAGAMRPLVTPEEWARMQAWPPDSCGGAVIRDPRNTRLVRLMEASVGDTSWAHSAPSPGPSLPASPSPAPTATSYISLPDTIREFYAATNEGRYEDAYGMLSRAARAAEPYVAFERRFREAGALVEVRSIVAYSTQAAAATWHVHTATTDRATGKGRACWFVEWRLIQEDGRWKRDAVTQKSEPCS